MRLVAALAALLLAGVSSAPAMAENLEINEDFRPEISDGRELYTIRYGIYGDVLNWTSNELEKPFSSAKACWDFVDQKIMPMMYVPTLKNPAAWMLDKYSRVSLQAYPNGAGYWAIDVVACGKKPPDIFFTTAKEFPEATGVVVHKVIRSAIDQITAKGFKVQ